MDAVEFMHVKLKRGRHELNDLVEQYGQLRPMARLKKSNAAFDEIYSYLQIFQNLILPYIEQTGRHEDMLARMCDVQNRLDQLLERAVMMHVDEHGGEYYNDMVRLLALVDQALDIDERLILPWSQAYLTPADHQAIASRLKSQMTHESRSSFSS